MKKVFSGLFIVFALVSTRSEAQIQRGNVMIGGDLANFNIGLQKNSVFQANLTPKVGFFIRDNTAVGAYVHFGLSTVKGGGTTTMYGVGPLARYYVNDPGTNLLRHGRLFFEGNVGIEGVSYSEGSSTTGLGLGIGPGYAYFITPNIGLETLLKFNGIAGFGSEPFSSNLDLNVGFQIYLGSKKLRNIANDANNNL